MELAVTRVVNFTIEQVVKTARRPSRVAVIAYRQLLYPALKRLGRGIMPILARGVAPIARWYVLAFGPPPEIGSKPFARFMSSVLFLGGHESLEKNKPEEACRMLAECIKYSDDESHFKVAAVALQVGLGRNRESIELHKRSNQIRSKRRAAVENGEYERHCFLDLFWVRHIGHVATIDYVIKLRMLEGRDPNETILYLPPGLRAANRYLVEQWRPHLRLITDPRQLPFPEEQMKYFAVNYYVPELDGVRASYWWEVASQTSQRWRAQSRQPVLKLAAEVEERGRKVLAGMGVPSNAWFVGLHVREPGYTVHHRGLHGVLNARIEDYLPAIGEIVERGGWVIRMGDPSMTPLPPMANVIDYCHSPARSDWMDVFLAATSRFFVGTSSGVCYVAQAYGVPCVLSNWWPPAQRPWHAGDIFLPKLLRRIGSGRALSLEQTLDEPFGYCNSTRYLKEAQGVIVEDNDPEDIRAAVVEMLERLDGREAYESTDIAMRERAESIYATTAMRLYRSSAAFGAGALARDFVRRNPSFLS
jgi:putative glycosyltransferase (TIGR04372 family)